MADDQHFARLVSLACHDVRTPLATVHGFAQTLARVGGLDETAARYLSFIDAGSQQLREVVDELSLLARVEGGRYEATREVTDSLELARLAAAEVAGSAVRVAGAGAAVLVAPADGGAALAALARCVLRHGEHEQLQVEVSGRVLELGPAPRVVAAIALGDDLRDFGGAVATRVLRAQGAQLEAVDGALRVTLPAAPV